MGFDDDVETPVKPDKGKQNFSFCDDSEDDIPYIKQEVSSSGSSKKHKRVEEVQSHSSENIKPKASSSRKSKNETKTKQAKSKRAEAKRSTAEQIWAGDLKGIYEIDGVSSDVALTQVGLSWSSVAVSMKSAKRRSRRRDPRDAFDDKEHLQFEDIIGVKIKRERRGKQVEGEGVCLGVAIQTFERKSDGRLKERLKFFGNPSQDICLEWSHRISSVVQQFTGRPRNVRVFLQPYAGKKNGRSIYKKEILPMFEMAGITAEITEVNHNEHIKHELIHMDPDLYDCIVCMGGDGTVTKVMSNFLTRIQKDNDREPTPQFTPVPSPLPIGIIPIGTINQICHSVQGVEDPITGAIHVILGNTQHTDICSIYSQEKFKMWNFNGHYGYFAAVLPFMSRYTRFGEKKIEAAFVKALTKAKFRSYECHLQYVPCADETCGHPNDGVLCVKGCSRCKVDGADNNHNGPVYDEVQSLQALNESGNSDIIKDMSADNPWKSTKGNFVSISVLSNAGLSDLAPRGMSKYSHISDGSLDLVMVKNTERKEFVRFLKRYGNDKNQLGFPFVEAIRCKEVRFSARSAHTWDHKDFGYNEILDEVQRSEQKTQQGLHRATSIEVIDDLDEDLADSDSDDDEKVSWATKTNSAGSSRSSASTKNTTQEKFAKETNTVLHVSENYRPTLVEQERARRMKSERKREERKKHKVTSKDTTAWNLDTELVNDLDLHFRVHKGLIRLCGDGIPRTHNPDEVRMGCLALV